MKSVNYSHKEQQEWIGSALCKVISHSSYIQKHNPEFVSNLAGRAYEELSYEYIASHLPPYRFLLTPEETFEYFRRLYPDYSLAYDSFGKRSIFGVAVPDGLLFDKRWEKSRGQNGLCGVYEYTIYAQSFLNYFYQKMSSFELLQRRHPELFAFAQVIFAVPEAYEYEVPKGYDRSATIVSVPVSPAEFRIALAEFEAKLRGE